MKVLWIRITALDNSQSYNIFTHSLISNNTIESRKALIVGEFCPLFIKCWSLSFFRLGFLTVFRHQRTRTANRSFRRKKSSDPFPALINEFWHLRFQNATLLKLSIFLETKVIFCFGVMFLMRKFTSCFFFDKHFKHFKFSNTYLLISKENQIMVLYFLFITRSLHRLKWFIQLISTWRSRAEIDSIAYIVF